MSTAYPTFEREPFDFLIGDDLFLENILKEDVKEVEPKKHIELSLKDYPGLEHEPIVTFSSIPIYPLIDHEFKYVAYYDLNEECRKLCFNSLDVGAQSIAEMKNPKDASKFIKSICK